MKWLIPPTVLKSLFVFAVFCTVFTLCSCGSDDKKEPVAIGTSLGMMRGQWTMASPPDLDDPRSGQYSLLSRWKQFSWYNPYEKVDAAEIWGENTQEGRTDVLALEYTPNDSGTDSWAGVMRALSGRDYDQSGNESMEVWVNGSRGRINIDLGLVSEDVIPNGTLNSEDRGAEEGYGDGILDLDEDVGLDGMANDDLKAVTAGGDFWDVDDDSVKDDWEPFSNDDWSYQDGSSNYTKINGTESNRNDPNRGIRPDTEDLNGNGELDTENEFFRYSFSLSPDSPDTVYVAGGDVDRSNWGHMASWRLYRLPLAEPATVMSGANMTDIRFVRIWITGVNTYTVIRIAAINMVGSACSKNRSGIPFAGF